MVPKIMCKKILEGHALDESGRDQRNKNIAYLCLGETHTYLTFNALQMYLRGTIAFHALPETYRLCVSSFYDYWCYHPQ